jgi:hypothetical protein
MLKGTTAQGTPEDYKFRRIYTMLENDGVSKFSGDPIPFILQEMIPYFEKIEDYEKCQFLQEIAKKRK